MNQNVLHVFSVPFSITYFVGEQFLYFKKIKGNNYFVACSQLNELNLLSQKLGFIPIPVNITRSINPISDIKAIISLIKIIKKNNINKIVGHSPKGAMVAMIAGKLAGIDNRIYFRHGIFYETTTGFKRKILKNIDRLSGYLATKVVCVSNAVKKLSEQDKLSSKDKNIILGMGTCNGVDAELRFNPHLKTEEKTEELKKSLRLVSDNFIVGFVGRIVKDKGIEDLAKAWEIVSKKYRSAKLLLIGPIEERDSITSETLQILRENTSIILTGNVSDTSYYYKLMDVFILPTYREGFPTVVLEASSMQLPIILTRATGCEEAIIEGVTGTFTTHLPYDIASAIEYFIMNPNRGKEMGKKGREFVKDNFEQTKIWDIINEKLDI